MESNHHIPHDKKLDNSLTLMNEGYLFIRNRTEHYQSDLFEARILCEMVICMTGEEAAKIFYDSDKFQRQGAAPNRIQQSLFGVGAIQTMDGTEHHLRKKLFLSHMTLSHQKQIAKLVKDELLKSVPKWVNQDEIILFEESKKILCKVACDWTNVPYNEEELPQLADDFIAMIYAFGAIGPEHWKGRRARNKVEAWATKIIENVRNGFISPDQKSFLFSIAHYQDTNGQLLDDKMAAVELMNVLRPIVAISTYIIFMALAFLDNPESIENNSNEAGIEAFVEEVRRYYPFGPFLGARVKQDFVWKNYQFKKGTLVLLDIYGTNHDARIWKDPNRFNPENFYNRTENLYNFIPQGGGDPSKTHRCPGEGITVEVMKMTLKFLLYDITFDIPTQDLSFRLNEMPTLPNSGFIIKNVRKK